MFALSLSLPLTDGPLPSAVVPLLTHKACWPVWLHDQGTWTLAALPRWILLQHQDRLLCLGRQHDYSYLPVELDTDLRTALKNRWQACSPLTTFAKGFNGGLIGWLGYDYGHNKPAGIDFPLACFACYDVFIRPDELGGVHLYAAEQRLAEHVLQLLQQPLVDDFALNAPFAGLMSKTAYRQAFMQVQNYLHSGDCYQVNLAQAFKAPCRGATALSAFIKLLQLSQAPYAAYLNNPYGEILSLSPELFLEFAADGEVLTRPIKGTRPRRQDPAEDAAQFADLATHPKDQAENLMIVDLLRNDLGKHAATGSVSVPRLFSVESFPQVHHLISTVRCRLKPESQPLDLLFDAFPGGSITGAPKKRAMEIIDELENCQRAIYCGSIGYLNADGRGQWNIAIRTLLRVGAELYAWAGGGIVADSDCESEYQECFNKIGAILQTLESGFLPASTDTAD